MSRFAVSEIPDATVSHGTVPARKDGEANLLSAVGHSGEGG